MAASRRRRWCWRPAASRSRRWGRPVCPTTVARRFGLGLVEPLPALVPLRAGPEALGFAPVLAGVSLEAIVSCGAQRFRESILFTHHGLSGPAILQISSYWRPGDTIRLDLLPDAAASANGVLIARKQARPRAEARTVLAELLPARLAQALAEACLPAGALANIPDRTLTDFAARLKGWEVRPTGTGGLGESRGDARGHRYPGAVVKDHGGDAGFRASMRSARRSTSPAGSAATISSGPGRAAGAPGRRFPGAAFRRKMPY